MKSLRVALCGAALALLAAASPGEATTTLQSGDYTGGGNVTESGAFSLGPGRYRINLTFTQPVSDVNGWVEKLFVYNDTCDMGEGEFDCGGDDDSIMPLFEMVTPELYHLALTVDPPRTVTYPAGSIVVREDQFDSCCTYGFDFTSGAPGHFALSFATVPEPATWTMMVLGFVAVGFAARRRNVRTAIATS